MSEVNGVSNGKTANMMLPPSEYVDFVIGGQPVRVKALTLWDLDLVKDKLLTIGQEDWISFSKEILWIISTLHPELSVEDMSRACSAGEARQLITSFSDLMAKSGFIAPGEEDAATEQVSPGTGTLTPSPPNSPSEESAAETRSE